MGCLSILLIPFYLRILGPEQWGVVALCMTLQAFFYLFDAGLSQIMPRDIAKVAHDPVACKRSYSVYLRAYSGLAVTGFMIGQLAIPWLVGNWFNGGDDYNFRENSALHLVMLQFLFQFSNNANFGYWNGMQLQVSANFRQCLFGSLKHIGALSALFFWSADAVTYLIPFIVISAIEFFINYRSISCTLKKYHLEKIKWIDYQKLGREAGILFTGVLIGMLAAQMDRIVLSKYVDIAEYGIYIIVVNLGLAMMQLQSPMIKAFLPRITQDLLVNKGASFKWLTLGILVLCILPCLVLAYLSPWILKIWINNTVVISNGALPLSLIFCAVAINSIYQLIYQRILIDGDGGWVVKTNVLTLIITTPALLLSASSLGIISGGIYWVLMTLCQLLLGIVWLRLRFNKVTRSKK